ncbi:MULTISPECIES: hypothetical protein [Streptococcus]|nr:MULTISPECIES: hypothetical protein [Streptococcus]MBW7803610.1 hypothetical protein [Streptococcus thermophilus]MBW7823156.1 hypothetical protein [Streptococcus thermophilus]
MTRTQIKFEVVGSMNLEDLQSLLKSNSKRIHQSLGYLTPNQFEKVSA